MCFNLQLSICERFPCLSPFDVRKQTAHEVFLLVKRLNEKTKIDKKNIRNGKRVIRKPASDNWF